MIIIAIISLAGVVLSALYVSLVGLPSLSASTMDAANFVIDYLGQGMGWLFYFTYYPTIRVLIYTTLVFETVVMGYKFVMWVAKKIPMFGVSD